MYALHMHSSNYANWKHFRFPIYSSSNLLLRHIFHWAYENQKFGSNEQNCKKYKQSCILQRHCFIFGDKGARSILSFLYSWLFCKYLSSLQCVETFIGNTFCMLVILHSFYENRELSVFFVRNGNFLYKIGRVFTHCLKRKTLIVHCNNSIPFLWITSFSFAYYFLKKI